MKPITFWIKRKMTMEFRMQLMLLAAAGVTSIAMARVSPPTINVCSTCSHKTIQSAVNDAASGDLISIAPGRYNENVTIVGKSLTLAGDEVIGSVVEVYAAGRGPVFTLGSGVAGDAPQQIQIIGLTISGGNHAGGTGEGGGVQVRAGAYLMLGNCQVTQNIADRGAGVSINSPGAPASVIMISQITQNWANGPTNSAGGGVLVAPGSAVIINASIITNNTSSEGGGVFADVNSQLTVNDSNISNNTANFTLTPQKTVINGGGGGIAAAGMFNISGSTINSNMAEGPEGGGGLHLVLHSGASHVISNSMVARNDLLHDVDPGLGVGAGVVVNNAEPVQQTITLSSDYIVENLDSGGLWLQGVKLASSNTTVKDNVGGQICSSAAGCTP
jgi:hypothetical protein